MSTGSSHIATGLHGLPLTKRPRWPYGINDHHPDVAYLRCALGFDFGAGNDKYVFDLSRRLNHATFGTNKPLWSIDGTMGPCMQFGRGGTKTLLSVDAKIRTGLTAATIFVCVRNFGNVSGSPIGWTTAGQCGHYPFAGADTGTNSFFNSLHSSRVNITDSPRKDWWHVLAYRCQAGSIANGWRVYQNGKRLGSATSQAALTSIDTLIGSADNLVCQTWSGFMADFRLFDRAMADDEIAYWSDLKNFWGLYSEFGRKTIFIPDTKVLVSAVFRNVGNLAVSGMNKTIGAAAFRGSSENVAGPMVKYLPPTTVGGQGRFICSFTNDLGSVVFSGRTAVIATPQTSIPFSAKFAGRNETTVAGIEKTIGSARFAGRSNVQAAGIQKTLGEAIFSGDVRVRASGLTALYQMTAMFTSKGSYLTGVLGSTRPLSAVFRNSRSVMVAPMDEWVIYLGPRDKRSIAVQIRDVRAIIAPITDDREVPAPIVDHREF